LLGRHDIIAERAAHLMVESGSYEIVDPAVSADREVFAEELTRLCARNGFTPQKARHLIGESAYFGAMMVRLGKADAMVAGAEDAYSDTIRTLLPILDKREGVRRVAGFNLVIADGQVLILGDTTLQIDPDARSLADIALLAADLGREMGLEPKVAMLSFSNFGDSRHPSARKVRDAVDILRAERPDVVVDGEMHGDVALSPAFAGTNYPHSRIQGDANILIFPNLDAANIAYKLIAYLGQGRESIGPILEGLKVPVNVASINSTPREIANLAAFSCFRAPSPESAC
jgi:malate dehydrogenase (oxaloacetate-decarboxylating)(NADP+)